MFEDDLAVDVLVVRRARMPHIADVPVAVDGMNTPCNSLGPQMAFGRPHLVASRNEPDDFEWAFPERMLPETPRCRIPLSHP